MWIFRNRLVLIAVFLFIVQQTNGFAPYVIFSEIMTSWGNLEKIFKHEGDPSKEIIAGIKKIQTELQTMGSGAIHNIELKVDDLPETQQRIDAFGRFNHYNLQIRIRAKVLKKFSEHDDFNKKTLKEFAKNSIGSGQDDINMLLQMLTDYLIGNDEITIRVPSLLNMFVNWMKDSPDIVCKLRISPQHFLYLLFDDFLTTNLKGFTIAQFSYMIRQTQTKDKDEKGGYCREGKTLYKNIIETLNKTKDLFVNAIRDVNQTVWRCEPKQHTSGITYDEATRFEQMMLIFKGVLDKCEGFCEYVPRGIKPEECTNWENCLTYKFATSTCNGRISKCIPSEKFFRVCPSKYPRRYEAIRNFIGRDIDNHYGKNTSKECLNGEHVHYYPDPCQFCMCYCLSDDSDRYFNLHEVVSNVADDMVVTGIRIKKHNRIFHLQIQEGKLIGQMKINSTTLRWTPLEDYKITDSKIQSRIDYHELEYLGSLIELPTHKMNSSYVVTGVKFVAPIDTIDSQGYIHKSLSLSVRFTEFDPINEKLFKSKSHWVTTTDSRSFKPVTLNEPDIPTLTYRSEINWDLNKAVNFQASDLEKDFGQTTIPFLDVQDVISFPPSPLSGVGLYHKEADGFGGFIGPKILTYDFADYLSSQDIPKVEFHCKKQKKHKG